VPVDVGLGVGEDLFWNGVGDVVRLAVVVPGYDLYQGWLDLEDLGPAVVPQAVGGGVPVFGIFFEAW